MVFIQYSILYRIWTLLFVIFNTKPWLFNYIPFRISSSHLTYCVYFHFLLLPILLSSWHTQIILKLFSHILSSKTRPYNLLCTCPVLCPKNLLNMHAVISGKLTIIIYALKICSYKKKTSVLNWKPYNPAQLIWVK